MHGFIEFVGLVAGGRLGVVVFAFLVQYFEFGPVVATLVDALFARRWNRGKSTKVPTRDAPGGGENKILGVFLKIILKAKIKVHDNHKHHPFF